MRTAFIEALCRVAAKDSRVWLVTGDLGYSVVEQFATQFPDRFLNAGVAEQNMAGVAAGLAMSGKIVYTYSIANFPVMRCLEQIRNDIAYHRANVKIVAVGGGLAYGPAGYSHHAVEDLAIMRVMPHMVVTAPGDPTETELLTEAIAAHDGPCYLRLGKGGERRVHPTPPELVLGRAIRVRDGNDLTIISAGGALGMALEAADILKARLLSLPTIRPLDEEAVRRSADETGAVITVEEHGIGGLGTAVAEALAEHGKAVPFRPIRLGPEPIVVAGTQTYLREQQGVSVDRILQTSRELCPARALT